MGRANRIVYIRCACIYLYVSRELSVLFCSCLLRQLPTENLAADLAVAWLERKGVFKHLVKTHGRYRSHATAFGGRRSIGCRRDCCDRALADPAR